ncbi:MAG TPA: tRNA epoxyqueuosine(34) reductase QueG [Halothiobacillaceae bacterium]|nr:tRNA epoxyqueuosine(34) reductase QueG [Halothiobacillaceae bacterium]
MIGDLALKEKIQNWALELGFNQLTVADTDLSAYEQAYYRWLEKNYHGEMDYMQRHAALRFSPEKLVPGTKRILMVSRDYLPLDGQDAVQTLARPELGYISRYATGRDYHKVMRKKLNALAKRITAEVGSFGYRAFTDSAPVYETGLAEKSGLGWKGKHSLLLNRQGGSWFFLGALFIDFELPVDQPVGAHCGSCTACMDICPTGAIVAEGEVDARRCISYLTIESKDDIPVELRPLMGNRIYGCDDCQLICPWNRFARKAADADFSVRHGLDAPALLELFCWDEATFLEKTEGMAIRRIGHARWLRNLAVAIGNVPADHPQQKALIEVLQRRLGQVGPQLDRHIHWALQRLSGVSHG